jgi:hypothetical protein
MKSDLGSPRIDPVGQRGERQLRTHGLAGRACAALGRGILLPLVLVTWACGSGQEAMVEEISSTGSYPLPVRLVSLEGGRDGYQTQVTVRFEGGADTELVVELTLSVDPRASLEEGRWHYVGPTGRASGGVVPESLRFVGGQGEGASVGGIFLLQEAETPRFRLTLPLTSLRSQGYGS